MIRTSNINSSKYTTLKKEFKANNLYAVNKNNCYVVYSYGKHFPIYVYKNKYWYMNKNKYSISTSKQQTQSKPDTKRIIEKNTYELFKLINDVGTFETHYSWYEKEKLKK